jgi:hypothetical protein
VRRPTKTRPVQASRKGTTPPEPGSPTTPASEPSSPTADDRAAFKGGPADPEAFARLQERAEAELGPEAPELVDDDAEPAEADPDDDDEPGASGPEDEGPPDAGDVELVLRTVVVGIGLAVGAGWPEIGARIRRTARTGARRFAEHFGPRMGHRGIWASLAVVASFVDLDPLAREREIEVGR